MRAYPITQVVIDAATQEVVCEACNTRHELKKEKLGSFGFIVQAMRLLRRHARCSAPANRGGRDAAEARELAALMAWEAEDMQLALEGRSNVVSFSRERIDSGRRGPTADSDPLCLHCGINRTYSTIGICGACQEKHGAQTCLRIVAAREREAAFAAGAGGVN